MQNKIYLGYTKKAKGDKQMKLNKIILTSIAIFVLCGTMAFAADAEVVEEDSGGNATYAGSVGDTGIPAFASSVTTLDGTEGDANHGDSVKLLTDVANKPLITYLYYKDTDVSDDAALYDADWDLSQNFTTNTFTVGVRGSTTQSESLLVKVAATPFALVASIDSTTGEAGVTAGKIKVAEVMGTVDTSKQVRPGSLQYRLPTSYTIKSSPLTSGYYYDPTVDVSETSINGVRSGKIVSFTLTSTGKSSLPAGRYQSIVELTYSID